MVICNAIVGIEDQFLAKGISVNLLLLFKDTSSIVKSIYLFNYIPNYLIATETHKFVAPTQIDAFNIKLI